jgi:hypothetical protein
METREIREDGRVVAVLEPLEHRILLAVEVMIEKAICEMQNRIIAARVEN